MERHDAAGAVAGALAAAVEVHREREVERVAHGRPDDVADQQRQSGQHGEIAAVARHHVEQDQRQQPQRQSCPVNSNGQHPSAAATQPRFESLAANRGAKGIEPRR